MSDDAAYSGMREGNMIGWAMLYEKYFKSQYFPKYFPYAPNLTIDQKKDIWSESMEKLFTLVRQGQFKQMKPESDFLLPGIIGIAKKLCRKMDSQNAHITPLLPEILADEEHYPRNEERLDMLKVRIAMQSLDDIALKILLLSYFPEKANKDKQTDEDRAQQLQLDTNENWDKNKYGVYRRRALQKLMNQYQKLDKGHIEQEVLKQDFFDYKFLNLSFPSNELYALMINKNGIDTEQKQNESIKFYLKQTHEQLKTQQNDRLYLYLADVTQWQNRLSDTPTDWTAKTIASRLEDLITSLCKQLFSYILKKQ